MEILNRLFSRGVKKDGSEDLIKITKLVGPLIDKTVNDIFVSYREKLVTGPITYIVPAVWGARKEGELDRTQKEMNQQIAPVIDEIFQLLQIKDLSGPKQFAIGFIIRGLIISKITYMIEAFKNRTINKVNSGYENIYSIENIEPLGSA